MIRKILFLAFALLFSTATMAQNRKTPSLDDLLWGGSNYWNLQPRNTPTAWWGDALVKTEVDAATLLRTAKGTAVTEKDKTAKAKAQLFTAKEINAVLDTAAYGKVRNLAHAQFPDGKKTLVKLSTPKATFYYNWTTRNIEWLVARVEGAGMEDFSAASRHTAYVKDDNLFVQTADGRSIQISTDGSRNLRYGTSVHRDEFGIHKGTYWSPDGMALAFYRMDQSMVTDYPLIDTQVAPEARIHESAPEKYPMAGMTSHKVSVGVFDVETQKTVYLQTGDPTDRYFTNIAWNPAGTRIYMFELPRSQKRAELVEYNARTGERLRVLFSEENARFVEPQTPIVFLPWDASTFIVQSERDGFNHLYLYNTEGKMLRQLTSGTFEVLSLLGFNAERKSVILRTNETGHIRESHYAVDIKTGRRTLLDNGAGVHRGNLSPGGRYLRDTWSKPDTYRVSEIISTARPAVLQRLDAFESPWKDYSMPVVENGSLTAADGKTPLYYRLVKPVGFDPSKKYPTVVYVYGGPHATNLKESWNYQARPWEYHMANKGYVIFVLDNRGSGDRGFEFESCTHRRLGEIEMADQMKGVEYLKTLPYVDADRMGVHGWSFGGFMTTNLMLTHNDVFKVGVAGGPVLDWKYYEAMYGERYMETPQTNPEGYEATSMVKKAGRLKGRLQIIVGLNDPVCLFQHSLDFLRASADAGTQPDYFVYPAQEHNMTGSDMVHLHERITRYFEDYLK